MNKPMMCVTSNQHPRLTCFLLLFVFSMGIWGMPAPTFGSARATCSTQEPVVDNSLADAPSTDSETKPQTATEAPKDKADDQSSQSSEPMEDSDSAEASDTNEETEDKSEEKLRNAREKSRSAPQQPFFNHWLWLAAIAFILFMLAYLPPKQTANKPGESHLYTGWDKLQVFGFRFTALHFVLFFMPVPYAYLPYVGTKLYAAYNSVESVVIAWVAENILNVSSDFVPYSGSGDSTEAYVRLFTIFSVALILSVVWTLIDRRKTGHPILRDVFHSNITYVLALTMLGYGLMKMGYSRNQFSSLSGSMLETTWGDSSPMGVLWKFMGASRPYTIFAGLGETTGALLLIFRRTRTLGALVIFGVMTNVVMLNFCYDVPVKINSTHLALLALCLILSEAGRLGNVLFFNRPTSTVDLKPAYAGSRTIWVQRVIKTVIVGMWFGLPLYFHVASEIAFARLPAEPEFFDSYTVDQFKIDGELKTDQDGIAWKQIGFRRRIMNAQMESEPTLWFRVQTQNGKFQAHPFEIDDDGRLLMGPARQKEVAVPEQIVLEHLEGDQWQLTGKTADGSLEVQLSRIDSKKTNLLSRGFRWINEVPFNR